jgi:hypothetical protein
MSVSAFFGKLVMQHQLLAILAGNELWLDDHDARGSMVRSPRLRITQPILIRDQVSLNVRLHTWGVPKYSSYN